MPFSTNSERTNSILFIIIPINVCCHALRHNAALRGEQRKPPNLNYCAINTKAKLRTKIAKR
ncbi:hypothetical protein DLH94_23510 [Vibrio parahaemolyticus]|nr:hypothetical protein [Vibrio parahaemolyticus]